MPGAGEGVKSWFSDDFSALSLGGQVLAVALAAALLYALLGRAGLRLSFARAAIAAVLVFMGVDATADLRERWHGLDALRSAHAGLSAQTARSACLATGPDREAVAWLGSRLPARARFYVPPTPGLVAGGGTCVRFLLLPRLQVGTLAGADHVVFWEIPPEPLLSELVRRGATVETFKDRYRLVTLP